MERWLEKVNHFHRLLEKKSFRKLTEKSITELFILFMKDQYGIDKCAFEEEFYKSSGYACFEKFILERYVLIKKDLRSICEKEHEKAKLRFKEYKSRVSELNKKIETEKDNYQKRKLKYVRQINEALSDKAQLYCDKSYIIRKSILNNSVFQNINFGGFDHYQFWGLEQYENLDWKRFINFGETSIAYLEKMKYLYNQDKEVYLVEYEKYILEGNLLEIILERFKAEEYLYDRTNVICEAKLLFDQQRWLAFSYVMIPQVEGLFNVLREQLNILTNVNGLVGKVDSLNQVKKIVGYGYYAFDFPKIRNAYAHGVVVEADKETAFDILMDVYYLSSLVENEDTDIKIVKHYLESFEVDRKINKFSCFTSSSINYERNIWILENCVEGMYNQSIEWYGLEEKYRKVIGFLKTDDFYTSICNLDSPIYVYKSIELEGNKSFVIKELQSKLCDYERFLYILNQYNLIDDDWYRRYISKKRILEHFKKQENNKIKQFLKNKD